MYKINEFCWRLTFEILIIHKSSLGPGQSPVQDLGLIGLAVLTFIEYKQTNKQKNKQTPRQELIFTPSLLI